MSDAPHPAPLGPYDIKKENGFPDWWVVIGPTPQQIQYADPNDAGLDADRLNAAYAAGKGDTARAVEAERADMMNAAAAWWEAKRWADDPPHIREFMRLWPEHRDAACIKAAHELSEARARKGE